MRRLTTSVLVAWALACSVGVARAETFLLEDGGRLAGDVVREWKDDERRPWLRVRTSYGHVDVPAKSVKRRLKTERDSHTVHVAEARITATEGKVQRSRDDGETWQAVGGEGTTAAEHEYPLTVRAGEQLRTLAESTADLDLGWGVLHLAAESELELAETGRASVRLRRGRMGGQVEGADGARQFRVETPEASMGVRGTVFAVTVADGESRFAVAEGEVVVGEESVGAGESLTVAADGSTERGDTLGDDDLLTRTTDAPRFSRIEWVLVPGGTVELRTTLNSPWTPQDTDVPTSNKAKAWAKWMDCDSAALEVTVPTLLVSRTEVTSAQFDRFLRWIERNGIERIDPALAGTDIATGNWANDKWTELADAKWREGDYPALVLWESADLFARWLGARLPSNSEWDHLARGDDDSPGGHEHVDRLNEVAWTWHNTGAEEVDPFKDPLLDEYRAKPQGHPTRKLSRWRNDAARGGRGPREVGLLAPNAHGLHDVFGNVWEWAADRFDSQPAMEDHPTDGSPMVVGDELLRMQRGGDFATPFWGCFVASARSATVVAERRAGAGIRLVRDLPE